MGADLNLVVECSRKPLQGRKRYWDELLHTRHIHHPPLMDNLMELHRGFFRTNGAQSVWMPEDASHGVIRLFSEPICRKGAEVNALTPAKAQEMVNMYQGRYWGKRRFVHYYNYGEGWMTSTAFTHLTDVICGSDLESKQLIGLSQLMAAVHQDGHEARLIWWFDD